VVRIEGKAAKWRQWRCPRHPASRATMAAVVAATAIGGCATAPAPPRAELPQIPSEQARCRVDATQQNPLVTEWPASEKSNLELRLREGGVAVAYAGCSMRILPECMLPGAYQWQRTTPATDRFEIRNEDELYARMPLGAASLEGELGRSGKLVMQTTVAGQYRLRGMVGRDVTATAGCERATHVVAGLSVGAFRLSAGGEARAEAKAELAGNKVTAERDRSRSLVREAGDPEHCRDSNEAAPNANCQSPIQLFLTPLGGRAEPEGPPGTVKVEFQSDPGSSWQVISGKQVLCTTPCTRWLAPATPLMLRDDDASILRKLSRRNEVDVPRLDRHAAAGTVNVHADSGSWASYLGGGMVAAIGVEVMLVGAMFALSDCGRDATDNRCGTGLKVLVPLGALITAPGIWLIWRSWPRARISDPGAPTGYVLGPAADRPGWVWGPGFVRGRF
jgi:hypothetical protein